MNRKRILFVDDEVNVLEGLQNLLRKYRQQWEMVFVTGGEPALAELAQAPFDVIVSDMRMPGMDGAALLRAAKERYPSVARIVLSGHAERESILRALPVAHQYLSKPCDPDQLRVVIERACALQQLLTSDLIRGLVGGLEKLPSVPQTYWELTKALSDPDITINDIARIVETDPAMCAKVLQVVNSAYFGLVQNMTSVARAVSYLGTDLLKGMCLNAHAFAAMGTAKPVEGFSMEALQQASLLAARIGGKLFEDQRRKEDAFTACLVHDIGQIILAIAAPEQWTRVMELTRQGKRLPAAETEVLGVTHCEVGAYLLGTWGLPFPIVEAVAYHHAPGSVSSESFDVLAAVHVADALADASLAGDEQGAAESELDLDYLNTLGVSQQLPQWQALAVREMQALTAGR